MISINNLHKAFGPKSVLNGIDLEIPTGETICIIGPSGCGKSVLLKHIVRLLEPDQGSVEIDGVDVNTMSPRDLFALRKRVGYVFQSAALFDSMTVYENVVLSLQEHGETDESVLDSEARRVLSAVQLLPDPDKTTTDEFNREYAILKDKKPSDLSGGMRKRVGVARALVGQPEYILYDEPTTGLDPVTSEQIDNLISDLVEKMNVTSIVITHDMFSVYKVARQVAMLHKGKVHFHGTPEELRQSQDSIVKEFIERFEVSHT